MDNQLIIALLTCVALLALMVVFGRKLIAALLTAIAIFVLINTVLHDPLLTTVSAPSSAKLIGVGFYVAMVWAGVAIWRSK